MGPHCIAGPSFIIPSSYEHKMEQKMNLFRYNMENSLQNIRGYTDIFYSVAHKNFTKGFLL